MDCSIHKDAGRRPPARRFTARRHVDCAIHMQNIRSETTVRPAALLHSKARLQQGQASPACAPCAPVGCDSSLDVDLSNRDFEILKKQNDLIHQVGDCHEQPRQEVLLSIAPTCHIRKNSTYRQDQIPVFDYPNTIFWFSWC